MKNLLKALAICLLCVLAVGVCHAEAPLCDVTVSGWHIVVEDAMIRQSMQNVTVELGYTDVQTDEHVETAPEGKLFGLIKLHIEKAGSREKIDWNQLTLTDGSGNEYHRAEDNFI